MPVDYTTRRKRQPTGRVCSVCGRASGYSDRCRQRPEEVPGYRDVYGQLCGFGPRVKLHPHVTAAHDGVAAYKRKFGPDSLTSESYRAARSTLYEDWAKDAVGLPIASPRRKRTCDNGHALRGDNVIRSTKVINGVEYEQRNCRKCWNEWHNEYRRNKRAARPEPTPRVCDWCGESFQPRRSGRPQRFCCAEHKAAWHNASR